MRANQIAGELLRKEAKAGVGRGLIAAGKGFLGSGKHVSKVMAQHGVESPVAHFMAKASPYAAAAYLGKKGVEKVQQSPTYQKLKWKLEERKQRKAMERAQRGY